MLKNLYIFLPWILLVVTLAFSMLLNRKTKRILMRTRASEQQLRKERKALEMKVRERTNELEMAHVEKLQELNRFAEFGRISSTLLHELANPLTSISLNLEQLKNGGQSKLIDNARHNISYLEQYVDNARRQLRNQSEVRSFNVVEEIKRVFSFLSPQLRQKHIKPDLKVSAAIFLVGDSIRFSQIFSNLIVNAIDAYGDVSLQRRRVISIIVRKHQTNIHITVRDTGKGMTEDQLVHIFEPFYTTKDSNRGTGLGLTITKRMIEDDFRGNISVTSNNQGTAFKIVLPLPNNLEK